MTIRRAAVAGSWYPGSGPALAASVDRYVGDPDESERDVNDLVAIIAPHAGIMYSGPVAGSAYRLLRGGRFDVAVLVGPSHFVDFEGVAVYQGDGFETPLGVVRVDHDGCGRLMAASPLIRRDVRNAHAREHSLEMQLPFLRRVAPDVDIVPLLVGRQTAATARALGDAIGATFVDRRALLVASSDLSHYHDAQTAARLDAVVIDHVARLDAEGLQRSLDAQPDHACGGGPMVAVMRAARHLGAREAAILKYADSGDVSGDKSRVVGYLAAAMGRMTTDSGPP
jgi:AmmeMemoRadiSam system protein B